MSYTVNFKSVEGNLNEKNENSYTTKWLVVADYAMGPIEAITLVGVNLYDNYNVTTEFDTIALCKERNAVPVPDSNGFVDLKQWEVTLNYGRVDYSVDNPLLEPVKVSINFSTTDEPVDYDIYGSPIMNTAGEPFAEAVTKLTPSSTITFERNEADYNALISYYYVGTVNLYPWKGIPKGCALMTARTATQNFNQNIGFYWTVGYDFSVDLNGYKKSVLNQGLRQVKVINGKRYLVPCVDETPRPVTSEVLLLRSGEQAPKMSTPIFLDYEVYNYADFSVFGL